MTLINLIPVWVYLITIATGAEHISIFRVGAVLMTFGGAFFITYDDMLHSPGNVAGGKTPTSHSVVLIFLDIAILVSTVMWAVIDILVGTLVARTRSAPYAMLRYKPSTSCHHSPFF